MMPLSKLRGIKKAAHAAVERQAPEPRNRMIRREAITERRASKQHLRDYTNAWPDTRCPQHVVD
jgi:hypothetical protein